jgi:septum formation protein
MSGRTLILASASPARFRLLRDAGFDPEVQVSGVDEDEVEAENTATLVAELAARKAAAVAGRMSETEPSSAGGMLVLGCDSMLEFEGRQLGKPTSAEEAGGWLRAMRGRSGTLFTGHCLIDLLGGGRAEGVASTVVRFAVTTDAELDAYLSTGDAMAVAGAFTLDGRSAPFIDGVEGDPSNVIGLSLPLFRSLLGELGVSVTDLWARSTV